MRLLPGFGLQDSQRTLLKKPSVGVSDGNPFRYRNCRLPAPPIVPKIKGEMTFAA